MTARGIPAPARSGLRCRYASLIVAIVTFAAAIGCGSGPARAQLDEWRQGMKAAYQRQFRAANALDEGRTCVAKQRGIVDRLGRSYRIEMDDREADLERDRTWREKLREHEAGLALYDSRPNNPPEGQAALAWLHGEALRKGTPPKSTPYPILEAREALRRLQGQFEQARRIRVELDQARARQAECERSLPALQEAFENALEQYEAYLQSIVPEDDSDIERLAALAREATEISRACGEMECPTVDCADSTRRLQGLLDAETHLADMVERLALARADAHKHHKALADQLRENSDRRDTVDTALTVQEGFLALGSALLDLASIVDGIRNVESILSSPKSKADLALKINQLHELAKNAESGVVTVTNAVRDANDLSGPLADLESWQGRKIGMGDGVDIPGFQLEPLPQPFKPVPLGYGTLKSHLTDLVALTGDAKKWSEEGPGPTGMWKDHWKGSQKALAMRASIGQLVGRVLKEYAQGSVNEMKDRLRELSRSVEAETAVMIPAAEQVRRIEDRHSAATDALYALQEARASQQACAGKACNGTTARAPRMPDFNSTAAAAEAVGGVASGWGEALQYHNAQIPRLSDAMPTAPARLSGRLCTGAPMTLTFRHSALITKTPRPGGGGLVGALDDVANKIEAAGGETVEATFSIVVTPTLERRPDGSVVAKFETGDVSADVSPDMPADRQQAARREMALVAARLKRSEVTATQAGGEASDGRYTADLGGAIGQLRSLAGQQSGTLTCEGGQAKACEPARR